MLYYILQFLVHHVENTSHEQNIMYFFIKKLHYCSTLRKESPPPKIGYIFHNNLFWLKILIYLYVHNLKRKMLHSIWYQVLCMV